jgi:ACT domain-containing protein
LKGIITVLGKDRVGIIAAICVYLSERGINILDISQSIVQGYFNMLMIVDFAVANERFVLVSEELEALGDKIGVKIKLQHEDIFNAMHRV